jgi:DNA-binding SARP family transcriptional activator/TolB-like protein/Flp pilus assembly protein TadD
MRACRLTLLGNFAFRASDGRELALATRKDRLLLAYLALAGGRPQERSRLSGLLWGDRGETQARDSLRQSLTALRQAFRAAGIEPLQAERETVTLKTEEIAIDACALPDLAEADPVQAMSLCTGELLAGIDGLTPEFEAWLLPERERLNDLAVRLLERLAAQTLPAADRLAALQFGRRLLGRDGTREPVVRAVMRLLLHQGERGEALKLYGTAREALQRELGVAPDAATEALYRNILTAASPKPGPEPPPAEPAVERPAVAVLPLRDLSGDGSLEALCDVLGEELVTGLGRFRELLVIDRHSAAAVAAENADLAEIGRKLAADLLVQGSVQRQDAAVRITVRLVKAATRVQLWGEAFELPTADLLSLPDKAIASIVATLHGRVEHAVTAERRPSVDLSAYGCLLKGIKHLRGYGADDNAQAIALFDQALAIDPEFHLARFYRAFADVVVQGYSVAPQAVLDRAMEIGRRATEATPDDGRCHLLLGMLHGMCGDLDRESECYRRAIELNPNDANAIAVSGLPLAARGAVAAAIERFRLAMRLNPNHPPWYWDDLSSVLYLAGRYADALECLQRISRPTIFALPRLAACLAQLGRHEEARAVTRKILEQNPEFRIDGVAGQSCFRGWSLEQAERFRDGMRKAGLPE